MNQKFLVNGRIQALWSVETKFPVKVTVNNQVRGSEMAAAVGWAAGWGLRVAGGRILGPGLKGPGKACRLRCTLVGGLMDRIAMILRGISRMRKGVWVVSMREIGMRAPGDIV